MIPVLEVRDLTFGYDRGRPVLRGVSFCVSAGESVGIAGANGAGKSTLLWCILGLHRSGGAVRLFGRAPDRQALERTAVVFQEPEDMLFMPRLIDDVALPLVNRGFGRAQALEKATELLRVMGLAGRADEPASHLSLGLKKRAAIAAALVASPELLVLDEPTAELDGRSRRVLADLLSAMTVTRLITSHDLEFLARTTRRLLVLNEGAILVDGLTGEVLADEGLLVRSGLR